MSPHPPDLEDARIFLGPDPLKATSRLFFPVLVLYPVHGQSDFLKAVEETEGWGGVLGVVLGGEGEGVGQGGNEKGKGGRQGMDEEGKGGNRLPWDKEGEYTVDGVESFMETKEGGMVKVGRKVRLLDVLAGGKVEVVDGVVRGFVVPKARVGAWVEEMKGRKGR